MCSIFVMGISVILKTFMSETYPVIYSLLVKHWMASHFHVYVRCIKWMRIIYSVLNSTGKIIWISFILCFLWYQIPSKFCIYVLVFFSHLVINQISNDTLLNHICYQCYILLYVIKYTNKFETIISEVLKSFKQIMRFCLIYPLRASSTSR